MTFNKQQFIEEKIEEFVVQFGRDVYSGTALLSDLSGFLEQALNEAITKAVEQDLKDRLKSLPLKFFEDEDHAVGGYISRKDLYELLSPTGKDSE
jgi:hypothetical protein